ncbi:MAG: pantetheine-phosphate adenylyltransferase [Bacilli bacterium]|nr:pantetheine-phosphate adenylyltransferase [Bacilli bacterium]
MKIAIYPGSFDPITNGHLDIIKRATTLFDKVIVVLAINNKKKYRFSLEERKEMVEESVKGLKNVEVDVCNGLTVEYAKSKGAVAMIRGLRVVSDFEYEWSLTAANRFIDSSIETVFLMANKDLTFLSSTTIDEMIKAGVDVSPLVPDIVLKKYNVK